jgi:hypothetical protein
LLWATDASAIYWEEVTASACNVVSGPGGGSSIVFNPNGSFGGSGTLICPFLEETDNPHHLVQSLDVYVYDGTSSDNIKATTCIVGFLASMAFCSAPRSTSSTGWKVMHPPVDASWQMFNGYAFLKVELPANGGQSQLSGFVARY